MPLPSIAHAVTIIHTEDWKMITAGQENEWLPCVARSAGVQRGHCKAPLKILAKNDILRDLMVEDLRVSMFTNIKAALVLHSNLHNNGART